MSIILFATYCLAVLVICIYISSNLPNFWGHYICFLISLDIVERTINDGECLSDDMISFTGGGV